MGIRERQDREKQAVREAILDAARDLFITEGYRNVSIRKIAERIEYSPAAIYSYFPSKDDIFYALAEEGFQRLDTTVRAVPAGDDPMADLRACWWAYYQFSKEHREFFELMFIDRSVPKITEQWTGLALVHEMLAHVAARLQRCIDAGQLPSTLRPEVALHVMWAALTGPATIGAGCRLDPSEDPDALAHDVLDTMLAGLTCGPALTFTPCPLSGAVQQPASSGARPHDA